MSLVVLVEVELHPGKAAAYLPLVAANAAASVRDEPGCRRFDAAQDAANPDWVVLYEIYDDTAAFERHLTTAHFNLYRDRSEKLIRSQAIRRLALRT